jgi:hypothetical protein
MRSHDVQPRATYFNWIGRTVRQVHEEEALHRSLAAKLKELVDRADSNDHRPLRQELLSHVEMEKHAGRLNLTPPAPTPCCWAIRNFLHLIGLPLVLLLLSPLLLLIAPLFLVYLRFRESRDPELFIRPDPAYVDTLAAQEDWDVSNQYNVFGDVKPGIFRRLTFKFLILLTDWAARHIWNRGFLTRIRTIHSARWVFLDEDRRVFFASNYDGSHEAYMDDFINKVGWGLNAAFSCGVGYPSTRWLLKDGASREQPFKYTQRRHQLPSEVWYKAYPGLTAVDLARNSRIRRGVEVRQNNEAEIREWLSLI